MVSIAPAMPRSDGSTAIGASSGCAPIIRAVVAFTCSGDEKSRPSRAKYAPPSGRDTAVKCCRSPSSASASRAAPSSASSEVAPSTTARTTSPLAGKAASIRRSAARHGTLGAISSLASLLMRMWLLV